MKIKHLFIFFTIMICCSCAKDLVKTELKSTETIIPKEKMVKIKRYISIMWDTPMDLVKYNPDKQEFIFGLDGNSKMSRMTMEELYDKSNEYKLVYEK